MGKGDKRRPQQVPTKQVEENWERTFGKPKPKEKEGSGET